MSKRSVLLVHAPMCTQLDNRVQDLFMPMGILVLGTFLHEHDIRIQLVDGRLNGDFTSNVLAAVADVDVVGFSVMTEAVPAALKATRALRQAGFSGKIVWGGAHPTIFPQQILQDPDIDFLVRGYGELPLLDILRSLNSGFNHSSIAPGLITKSQKRSKCMFGKPTALSAVPKYSLLDIEEYLEKILPLSGINSRVARILTSRGCPYRCAFCINSVTQYQWSPKSLNDVKKDIQFVTQNLGCNHVNVLDELPFPSLSRAIAFGELIASYNSVTWSANMTVKGMLRDKGHLKILNRLGLITIVTGAESGSNRVLNGLGKSFTSGDLIRTVEACLQAGIRLVISFMIGMPNEEREDIIDTISIIDSLKSMGDMVRVVGPQLYRPYPGTPIFEQLFQKTNIPKSISELADSIEIGAFWTLDSMPWIKEPKLVNEIMREYDLYREDE